MSLCWIFGQRSAEEPTILGSEVLNADSSAGLALCLTSMAKSTADVEVVVPTSAAHPQDWLHPRFRDHPKPNGAGKAAASLAEFVAPEVISRIVVEQYAGPPDDVRRYLSGLPTAAAKFFGPSLVLCKPSPGTTGAALAWTSTSTIHFESGKSGRLAIATVYAGAVSHFAVPSATDGPGCLGSDKVPFDSLYGRYADPDGYSWYFAVPLQKR